MASFKKFGLSNPILKAIKEIGFVEPSEIQSKSIPILMTEDRDFIGLAQTGTGKTAAFGLPLLDRIDPGDETIQGLVIAPTRELGQQIAEQLKIFSKYMHFVDVLAVYGGASITAQMKALRKKPQVIIATPGRLYDLIKRKAVKLNALKFLVLDEADEMLNMGFKEEIDNILSYTPDSKLTWLFSATMPKEINKLVKKYMDKPFEVRIDPKNTVNKNIEHQFVQVKQSDKTEAVKRFLNANPDMRGLVFCRTKRDTQELAETLLKDNYKVDALHGDLSQAQRDRVMKRFKSKALKVVIATDVAARGIDVNDLTHVFHYKLPDDSAYYTHRSGRTARAGKKGISIAFINNREKRKLESFQKQLGIKFNPVLIPNVEDILDIRLEKWALEILNTKTKNKIEADLLQKVNQIFGNISKEELIAKIAVSEISILSTGGDSDLNDKSNPERRERGGRRNNQRRRDRGKNRRPYGDKPRSKGGKRKKKEKYSDKPANKKKKSRSKKDRGKK